ncbi:MAG: peptide deformylase [Myxococcota bacterium]|jgi:peptide deformylase|nr:peptide deformylase [Myxococcota bacterium]
MALRDIILYPHDVLSTKAAPVGEVDDALRQLVDDMIETMYDAPGIGLAAPQIGILQRLTVIDISSEENPDKLYTFINPQIVHAEGRIVWEEGCLSIPGAYEKVERSNKIVVQALDRDGEEFELEADGLLAVAIQHEIDHLDGVVFLDHLSSLKRRMALKKYKKNLEAMEKERLEKQNS